MEFELTDATSPCDPDRYLLDTREELAAALLAGGLSDHPYPTSLTGTMILAIRDLKAQSAFGRKPPWLAQISATMHVAIEMLLTKDVAALPPADRLRAVLELMDEHSSAPARA